MILSMSSKDSKEQREIIESTFDLWKGNEEQIDDVCVIGVRV